MYDISHGQHDSAGRRRLTVPVGFANCIIASLPSSRPIVLHSGAAKENYFMRQRNCQSKIFRFIPRDARRVRLPRHQRTSWVRLFHRTGSDESAGERRTNQEIKQQQRGYNKAEKEVVYCFLRRESSMEEEWMRDRALFRDLLGRTPHASPQELAQELGRSVSWVKQWRKRLAAGDLHDPSVLCSYSPADHAPCCRWDVLAARRIVEMRFAAPREPEACAWASGAALLPCPATQSCKPHTYHSPAPAERFGRSCMLLAAWSLVPKSRSIPPSFESHWKRSRWISKMRTMRLPNRARKANASMWSKVSRILPMPALQLPSFAQAREDFHEQAALEAVIAFLRQF